MSNTETEMECDQPTSQNTATASQDDPSSDAEDYARIKVRCTKDDAKLERDLSAWEKDVRLDAAVNGGIVPPAVSGFSERHTVRLFNADKRLPPPADTETELNGIIAECRFLMREVAYASACLSYDPGDRLRYLGAAESLAITATKVGRTVAKLRRRDKPQRVEMHRHEMVYTHVQAISDRATTAPSLPLIEAQSDNQ